MKRDGTVKASVTVTNTGKRAGETVIQLYLHDVVASISRPVKELRGFEKIMLQPGESRTVNFTITPEDLTFYNAQMQQVVEPGKFEVFIGVDSQRVKAESFTLL